MKYAAILSVIAGAIGLLVALIPPDGNGGAAEPQPVTTLVFFDRSALTGPGALEDRAYRDSLEAIGQRRMRTTGDRMSAFLVHARTRGKADRLDRRFTHEMLDEKRGSSGNRVLAAAQNREAMKRTRDDASASLLRFVTEEAVSKEHAAWTDLWGTLEVISDEMESAPRDVLVYYFSDMYESVRGAGRRDFHSRPPSSRPQAIEWAKTDAGWILENMGIDTDRLSGARIRVILGRHGDRPEAPHVRAYWETLFTAVGIDRSAIRYN